MLAQSGLSASREAIEASLLMEVTHHLSARGLYYLEKR